MSADIFDLVVIGSGPGGYVAAERAGAKGLKVALVEKGPLGGVCLNEGCIPSKTLLQSAKLFSQALHSDVYGVETTSVKFSLPKAMARKQKVIETQRKGVAALMKMNRVEVIQGSATLLDKETVSVADRTLKTKTIFIATGSSPARPPIPGGDLPHVVTSTELLNIEVLPKHAVIIGGGVIGCEFACFLSEVGVKVAVVEMLPEIVPALDSEVAGMLRRALDSVDFHLGCKVEKIESDKVIFSQNGEIHELPADLVLMSIGRVPNLKGLGLEKAGVDFDRRGIFVDEHMRCNIPNIYALGDVNAKSMLAHSASRMAEVAVNHLTGKADHMRYDAIPWVVYTHPEVAGVGMTEAQAKERGIEAVTVKVPMTINGRFLAENEGKRGLCKTVFEKKTGRILGVHMIGGACSEMIFGSTAFIEGEFRAAELREIVFPHPTVSEVIRDSAWNFGNH